MNPAFFDLQGNPIGAYAEYINMIMHYKDSFYRLYFMMTGVNLNLLSHIGINSFLTDLKFVDLEEVLLVRDFISTFLTTVDGILGNAGAGRIRPTNSSIRFNGSYYGYGSSGPTNSGTEGRFARPKLVTYKYSFKEPFNVSETKDLKYSVMGTKQVQNASTNSQHPALEDTKTITYIEDSQNINLARSPNFCTVSKYEMRLQEEWRMLNNDYTSTMPTPGDFSGPPSSIREGPNGYSNYTSFGVKQLIKSDDHGNNVYYTNNNNANSKSIYLYDSDHSLHASSSVNRFNHPQDYNQDAIELSLALIQGYKTEPQPKTQNFGQTSVKNLFNRNNALYKLNVFEDFINDNLAATSMCIESRTSILDFDDDVDDDIACAYDPPAQEGNSSSTTWANATFTTSEYIDSNVFLDPNYFDNFDWIDKGQSSSGNQPAKSEESTAPTENPCPSISDFVTSRVLSNMRGYNILRRKDVIQGNIGQKFDIYYYYSALQSAIYYGGITYSQYLPQNFFVTDLTTGLIDQGGELSFAYQANLILQQHRHYGVEYLYGYDEDDMTEVWLPLDFTALTELYAAGSTKIYLCRLKLFNESYLLINNSESILNYPVMDKHFLLVPKANMFNSTGFQRAEINIYKDNEGGS